MIVAPLMYLYLIPLLLGYLLFISISGRVSLLPPPARLADRPTWLLGAWMGTSLALVLAVGLGMAHGRSSAQVHALLIPGVSILAALLLPGLLIWQLYRDAVARRLDAGTNAHPAPSRHDEISSRAMVSEPNSFERASRDITGAAREPLPPVATFLGRIELGPVKVPNIPVAPADTDETAAIARTRLAFSDGADPFRRALREERRLRMETEKHLSITRRALNALASESREQGGDRIDVLIALEEELESRIRESVATESALDIETTRRVEVERKLAMVERDMLSARHAARRGARAHARAINAATRSVGLARQALQTRKRAEERLRESERMLASRQAMIGALVNALERQRAREPLDRETLEDSLTTGVIDSANRTARTLRLAETRRLASRLARKAERLRPLTSGD